jgi:hypothetical protein
MSATGVFRQVGGIENATGWIPNDLSPSGGRSTETGVNRRAWNGSPKTPHASNLSRRQLVTIGKEPECGGNQKLAN